ncbi:MAG: hypothetical protein Kow0032_18290 [Methyloligellaceae bacterium]
MVAIMSVIISPQKTSAAEPESERNIALSVLRGLRRRCPRCGGARTMFRRFLKTHEACPNCGEELHHHRADDGPAYLTILIVGHLVVPVILSVEMAFHPPVWMQMAFWLPAAAALCIAALEPIKGGFVGLQWALRMHGFGGDDDGLPG